ncbi:MAG: glycosyl hydrolase family 28 protein, partial [Armatimonadota bacterium]
VWWKAHRETRNARRRAGISGREPDNPPDAPLKWPRPRTINLYRCKNVLISGITILNSPAWTIHPVYCENVSVEHVSIIQPYSSPNTDGINPDSCKNVRISNCYLDCGDDCITLKSGYNADGRRVGIPCENIVVTNCTMAHGHGGVVIGSETSGDVRNVTISNCVFDGTQRGIRIKSQRGRGGVVENIRVSNLVMRNITDAAFSITMFYGGNRDEVLPVDETTPQFRNIHMSDVIVTDSRRAALIEGLPEMPIRDISLSNIVVESAGSGIRCWTATGVALSNVVVNPDRGPALIMENVRDIEIHRFANRRPDPATPVIQFHNVDGALVQSCSATEGTGTFLQLVGDANRDIVMTGNRLGKAAKERETVASAPSYGEDGGAVALSAVPQAAQAVIKRELAGASIGDIERDTRDGRVVYRTDAELKGKDVELIVAVDGTLVRKDVELDVGDLPKTVRGALEKAMAGEAYEIDDAELRTEDGKTFYKIDVDGATNSYELHIGKDGTLLDKEIED